ncbi:MAG: HlyC/CorC family transporter [Chloroflexi bacterium]|nr:HlyC/CorC family transporter [Chloroflexota bacterium]
MAHSESKKESTGNHQRNSRRSSTGLLGKLISLFRRNRHASQDPPPAILVDTEGHEQILEEDESQMVRSIIALDETMAREIMVPRIDVVALDVNTSLSDVVRTIIERGFSRIPIYEDTIDNIVGVLYAKDILRFWGQPDDKLDIRKIARTPHFIPETKRIDELLQEFRAKRVHMAIVVDEYGGVAGLVSLEDLVEEIVGEIEDEFDTGEPQIETISPTEVIMDAGVSIDLLNETLSLDIQGEDFDSIGGFIYDRLGKIPSPGDEIRANGFVVSVLSTTGRRIRKVKIVKVSKPERQE